MAWLGKVSLGNLGSDFAGAVTKLSESVKNIEKNFDSALGFEDKSEYREAPKSASEKWTQPADPAVHHQKVAAENGNFQAESGLFNYVKLGLARANLGTLEKISQEHEGIVVEGSGDRRLGNEGNGVEKENYYHPIYGVDEVHANQGVEPVEKDHFQGTTLSTVNIKSVESVCSEPEDSQKLAAQGQVVKPTEVDTQTGFPDEESIPLHEIRGLEMVTESMSSMLTGSSIPEVSTEPLTVNGVNKVCENAYETLLVNDNATEFPSEMKISSSKNVLRKGIEFPNEIPSFEVSMDVSPLGYEMENVEKLRAELQMMEAALQGAAKQAQSKADEISRLMAENEHLKSSIDDSKKKPSDVELDALREEYQQRLGAAERKVYLLTKERDTLRREQNRKSDSSLLLKEKDEIIKQVMAEGEELSKKQAVQEGTMKKLRAQIRDLEEEKQRLMTKLQVEEGKVESIRKDKAATEKALQEAVEKGQIELAALKDYYTTALSEAKDAEARAEARVDTEAKADLERRFRESANRENTLLQTLDELRVALSRTEQQAAFREDMSRRDLEDLEKRCQAAESRYEELITRMPDSTRPLLRQIEALQESTAIRTEAWSGVERSLNARLQEAEAKAAACQERERASTERLSQSLSRIAVMEAQLSCLRAEQSQLARSLEKERQRASEHRQESLAAIELATTQEGRAKQLEDEIKELWDKYKRELKEEKTRRHILEQEIEKERATLQEHEKQLRNDSRSGMDKIATAAQPLSQTEFSTNNKSHKRISSASSVSSVEESFFLQSSMESLLDRPPVDRLSFSERPPSPYTRATGSTFEQLEAQLRQKEGELNSCFSRLASLESTRDSLAEELVKTTTQCELLRAETSLLGGLRAELDSLRQRHTSALELMGERDEQVEELKADLADIKQMYREQIDMLVGQIERLSAAVGSKS